jgi:hypothetical protein
MHESRNTLISEILYAVNLTGNSNECKFMATILIQALALHAVLEISQTSSTTIRCSCACISSVASHYGNVNDFLAP